MTQDAPDAATRVLTVRGEIDLGSAAPLKSAVRAILDGGTRNLVIDLTATDFVDSAGLSVFIGAYKRLHAANGRLVIVNANPATAKTFAVTALDRVFTIVATREAALASITGGTR